jgi:hypothetical protein
MRWSLRTEFTLVAISLNLSRMVLTRACMEGTDPSLVRTRSKVKNTISKTASRVTHNRMTPSKETSPPFIRITLGSMLLLIFRLITMDLVLDSNNRDPPLSIGWLEDSRSWLILQ